MRKRRCDDDTHYWPGATRNPRVGEACNCGARLWLGMNLNVEEWVRERIENTERIAATKTGADRDGWLEDGDYLRAILIRLSAGTEPVSGDANKSNDPSPRAALSGDLGGTRKQDEKGSDGLA